MRSEQRHSGQHAGQPQGADEQGRKELVAVSDGYRESKSARQEELLLDLRRWGLRQRPRLATEKRLDSTEGRLQNEIKATEGRLQGAISGLREDMKEGDGKLDTAINGLRGDMTTGFLNLTDRVSRVEGVIAGKFPGVRNQAQETRQEGVA